MSSFFIRIFKKFGHEIWIPQKKHFSAPEKDFFQKTCREYLGIKYLKGGNSLKGIDCSALAQSIIYRTFSLLLPKKSLLQRKLIKGENPVVSLNADFFSEEALKKYRDFVSMGDFGELIFLRSNGFKRTLHVGIWYDKKGNLVIHSCLHGKGVVVEEIKKVLERYEEW